MRSGARTARREWIGVVVAATIGFSLVSLSEARAGGTVFDAHNSNHAWGERLITSASFGNHVDKRGSIADGPWLAYLNTNYVPTGHISDGTLLGRVAFDKRRGRQAVASLAFTVPEVAPGKYVIQLCNVPCTMELGDFVATYISIVSTAGEVELLRRIDHLRAKADRIDASVREKVIAHVRALGSRLRSRLASMLDENDDDLRSGAAPRTDQRPPWGLLIGVGSIGMVTAYGAGRHRRPK